VQVPDRIALDGLIAARDVVGEQEPDHERVPEPAQAVDREEPCGDLRDAARTIVRPLRT